MTVKSQVSINGETFTVYTADLSTSFITKRGAAAQVATLHGMVLAERDKNVALLEELDAALTELNRLCMESKEN